MIDKEDIIKTLVQSAVIEKIVESKIDDKITEKLKNMDYQTERALKEALIKLLDDYSVKEKIKKIK